MKNNSTTGDYGAAHWLDHNLVEVVPRQGIELGPAEVESIYEQLTELCGGAYALLVNRRHDYSLTYDAHGKVADHPALRAIAYLVYSEASAQVAEYTAQLAHYAFCPIRVFRQRDAAIAWLRQQLAAESAATARGDGASS